MATLWWKRSKTTRYPRILKDTHIRLATLGTVPIKANTLVTPVRKAYLSYDHDFKNACDEVHFMLVDTFMGLGIVPVEDVEW